MVGRQLALGGSRRNLALAFAGFRPDAHGVGFQWHPGGDGVDGAQLKKIIFKTNHAPSGTAFHWTQHVSSHTRCSRLFTTPLNR